MKINEQFLLVISFIILLISGIIFYSFYEDNKNSSLNESASTTANIITEQNTEEVIDNSRYNEETDYNDCSCEKTFDKPYPIEWSGTVIAMFMSGGAIGVERFDQSGEYKQFYVDTKGLYDGSDNIQVKGKLVGITCAYANTIFGECVGDVVADSIEEIKINTNVQPTSVQTFQEPAVKPTEITYEYISQTKYSNEYVGKTINWKGVFSNQTCLSGPKLWPYDEKFLNGERHQYEWFWVIPRETGELMTDPNFDGKWCSYVLKKYGGLSEDQIDAEKDIYLVTGEFTGNDCGYYDLSVFNKKICIPIIDVISIKKVGSRADSIIPN